MAKYKNNQAGQPISSETIDQSMKIANATKKPNQTKEQTKLIAQGIQKGIAEYKKQQKAKMRDLNKQKKKLGEERAKLSNAQVETASSIDKPESKQSLWLPWGLLVASWLAFISFFWVSYV